MNLYELFFKEKKELPETIMINDTTWATTNAGTDKNNPLGKLYTIDEALALEDENWRLPTREEVERLKLLNKSYIDKRKLRVTIIEAGSGNLVFPWNYRPTRFGGELLIGGYWTRSYELCPYFSDDKYYLLFEIGRTVFGIYPGIIPQLGIKLSVRLVKR